jgi:hypothetical protein
VHVRHPHHQRSGELRESLLEISARYQATAHIEPDHHEAGRAFVEERAPNLVLHLPV